MFDGERALCPRCLTELQYAVARNAESLAAPAPTGPGMAFDRVASRIVIALGLATVVLGVGGRLGWLPPSIAGWWRPLVVVLAGVFAVKEAHRVGAHARRFGMLRWTGGAVGVGMGIVALGELADRFGIALLGATLPLFLAILTLGMTADFAADLRTPTLGRTGRVGLALGVVGLALQAVMAGADWLVPVGLWMTTLGISALMMAAAGSIYLRVRRQAEAARTASERDS